MAELHQAEECTFRDRIKRNRGSVTLLQIDRTGTPLRQVVNINIKFVSYLNNIVKLQKYN